MAELVDEEVARPLGIERGMHLGAPAEVHELVAQPVGSALRRLGSAADVMKPVWTRARRAKATFEALHIPGFDELFQGSEPAIWTTEMAAVNGVFSARALATMYGALANGGEDLLSEETVNELGRVQVRTADMVLGLRMRWRLGYHQAFLVGRPMPRAFGHYGYGGSGAWADPTTGLSVGFVTNRIGSLSTPMGDLTLARLNRIVRDCVR
jgi:CubicO group peptidase (beta-lactamase class C family)